MGGMGGRACAGSAVQTAVFAFAFAYDGAAAKRRGSLKSDTAAGTGAGASTGARAGAGADAGAGTDARGAAAGTGAAVGAAAVAVSRAVRSYSRGSLANSVFGSTTSACVPPVMFTWSWTAIRWRRASWATT
jgi:hypothetical protein